MVNDAYDFSGSSSTETKNPAETKQPVLSSYVTGEKKTQAMYLIIMRLY